MALATKQEHAAVPGERPVEKELLAVAASVFIN